MPDVYMIFPHENVSFIYNIFHWRRLFSKTLNIFPFYTVKNFTLEILQHEKLLFKDFLQCESLQSHFCSSELIAVRKKLRSWQFQFRSDARRYRKVFHSFELYLNYLYICHIFENYYSHYDEERSREIQVINGIPRFIEWYRTVSFLQVNIKFFP